MGLILILKTNSVLHRSMMQYCKVSEIQFSSFASSQNFGESYLVSFLILGTLDVAQWLIDTGCDIHRCDMYGVSPVRVAAIERNAAAIKLLIKGNYFLL